MKKIFCLLATMIATMAVYADGIIYPVGDSNNDNSVIIEFEDTEDLDKVPFTICLENPTKAMTGFSSYFYIDNNEISEGLWVYDEDEEDYAYDTNSKRLYKSHTPTIFICDASNPDYPSYYYLSIVSTSTQNFKLNSGALITLYFDATKLEKGTHCLHIVDPCCFDEATNTYKCLSEDFEFSLSDGKLTVINAVPSVEVNSNNLQIFDLQGRSLNALQHGVNIVNGKKVIR